MRIQDGEPQRPTEERLREIYENMLAHMSPEQRQAMLEEKEKATRSRYRNRARNAKRRAKRSGRQKAADGDFPPIGKHGGPRRKGQRLDYVNLPAGGNSTSYLVGRLKRDAPEYAEDLACGVFSSAREAAVHAGIVRIPDVMECVKKSYLKLAAQDQAAFRRWLARQR
jgi:hypothetical protein